MPNVRPAFGTHTFEDKNILRILNGIFTKRRGYPFHIPTKDNAVILLLSGGMDSICLWYVLMNIYHLHVYPLHFLSAQQSEGQKKSLRFFSDFFKKNIPTHFHPIKHVHDDSLFNLRDDMTRISVENDTPFIIENLSLHTDTGQSKIHSINNPGRLGRFAFRAYEYALYLRYRKQIDVLSIFTGVVPDDSLIVRESTLTVMRSINLSLCLILGDFRWQFTAPFEKGFYFTKIRLLRICSEAGLPIEKTWSCDQKGKIHCGICLSCRHRKETFKKADYRDNTTYNPIPFSLTSAKKKIATLLKPKSFKPGGKTHFKNTDIILVSPQVSTYEARGKKYLLQNENGSIRQLNLAGTALFSLIENGDKTTYMLAAFLQKKHNITKKGSLHDVRVFISELLADNFLYIQSNQNGPKV